MAQACLTVNKLNILSTITTLILCLTISVGTSTLSAQTQDVQAPVAQAQQQQVGQPQEPQPAERVIATEPYIPATEAPQQNAAHTKAAGGNVSMAGHQINFPRDPKDDLDVLKMQIFLDYHGFSVGQIDGQWGYNTGRGIYQFQKFHGIPPTGQMDDSMLDLLAKFDKGYLVEYSVTSKDVKGPFYTIPRSYAAMSKLKALPYESALEGLGEKFHCAQSLLRKLNPGVNLDNIAAGTKILAPNVVNGFDETKGKVGKVRVSKNNKWIEVYDTAGQFMYFYPCTLGSPRDPLPLGTYSVVGVQENPHYSYNPSLFWDSKPGEQPCTLAPGPNGPVGDLWIGTSRKSLGIHGTPNPEAISRNNSHGCIRLCNWDVHQLGKRVEVGTKLEFVE